MKSRNTKRIALVSIIALFLIPLGAAYLLNKVGWRPAETRNYGVLQTPALDLGGVQLIHADGSHLEWRDASTWPWMLLAVAGEDCGQECVQVLDQLRRVRLTLNHRVDRLRVVVVDYLPDAQEQAYLDPLYWVSDPGGELAGLAGLAPGSGKVSVALVDPNGFLVLRYPAGFDATKLRRDVTRLVK